MVEFQPRTSFDGYQIERLLGKGGMGAVYLATDTLLERKVAIKFIRTDEDATARQRFLIEARAIARLQHPNVVAIYRVGEVDGFPYLVSEFIRGRTLDTIERPITFPLALQLSIGISCALSAAHQKGVLHRDIKPANAILSDDGVVKLLDFGVAKLVRISSAPGPNYPLDTDWTIPAAFPIEGMAISEDTANIEEPHPSQCERRDSRHLTEDDTILGTPHFMAPELWLGAPASFHSDIYAFGMLIYTLLCKSPPHAGSNLVELRHSIMTTDPPPLIKSAPHVDRRFGEIIDRCLKRDPADRFNSINEARAELERLTGEVDWDKPPEGNPYRGLFVFDAEHQRLFFGRDSETRLILERLSSSPCVVAAGDPGVGKSSLCRAGVLPRLDTNWKAPRQWRSVKLLPGRYPARALGTALAPIFDAPESAIIEALTADPGGVARDLRAIQGDDQGLIIFIDQLEELVTISEPDEVTEALEFLSWILHPSDSIRLLATARGDFLSRLAALPLIGDQLSQSLFFVRPLSPERLEEAIECPARLMGISFESRKMITELAAATCRAGGTLPKLQQALADLWEARNRKAATIHWHVYTEMGEIENAIDTHADGVLEKMRPLERAAAKEVVLRLITPENTRTQRTLEELNIDSKVERAAVDALVRGNLLTVRETGALSMYELVHDILIRDWSTLAGWLSSGAETRWALERLGNAARKWSQKGRPKELLWQRCELKEIEWISPSRIKETERRFIDASWAAVRTCRLKRWGMALTVPLVIALIFGSIEMTTHAGSEKRIGESLKRATLMMAEIAALKTRLIALRRAAMDRFDHTDIDKAEQIWARYLRKREGLGPLYRQTGKMLETALLIDPDREDVRELFSTYLFERALSATARGAHEEAHELIERLPLYAPSDTHARHLPAGAAVTVRTVPDNGKLALYRYSNAPKPTLREIRVSFDRQKATPVVLTPGSYLLSFDAPGRAPVHHPFEVGRRGEIDILITSPRIGDVPEGFVYVPEGWFNFGSGADESVRKETLRAVPIHPVRTGAYLIADKETTFAQWLAYLSALPTELAERRSPRVYGVGNEGSLSVDIDDSGRRRITFQPTVVRYQVSEGAPIRYAGRQRRIEQDWLKMPVVGISADDAAAYAAWLNDSGQVPGARLCTELEWERGARGADDRRYPHGFALEGDDANTKWTHGNLAETMGPDEVGSHPTGTSPFGLHDMAGNAGEWTRSSLKEGDFVIRGGSFLSGTNSAKATHRTPANPDLRRIDVGLRVCADPPSLK